MKKHLHLFCLATLLSLYSAALSAQSSYPVVANKPAFLAKSSSTVTLSRVVLSDESTLVSLGKTAYSREHPAIGSSTLLISDKGIGYPLQALHGVTTPVKIETNEAGDTLYTYTFAPLPAATRYFSLIEGKEEKNLKIFGIALTAHAFSTPKSSVTYDMNETLIPSVISGEKALVKGKILNFLPGMEGLSYNSISIPLSGEVQRLSIPVKEDGTFTIEIAPRFPIRLTTTLGNFFVVPGHTTQALLTLKPGYEAINFDIDYTGTLASLNKGNAIVQGDVLSPNFMNTVLDTLNGTGNDEAIARFNSLFAQQIHHLDSLPLSHSAREYYHLILSHLYLGYRGSLPDYCSRYKRAWDRDSTHVPYRIPAFAQGSENQNLLSIAALDYDGTPYFSYMSPLFFKIKQFTHPLAIELRRALALAEKAGNGTPLSPEEQKEAASFSSPLYGELIEQAVAQAARDANAFAHSTNDVYYLKYNDVPDSLLVSTLLAPYTGKPVLVDVWATWCGPCKAAMKTIEPVKAALAGKVTFLYLTGETSPKEKWMQMMPTIHGAHCYVTDRQYNYLLNHYESQGVPTYLLFDKAGKFVKKYVGYPGNEEMQTQLENLL